MKIELKKIGSILTSRQAGKEAYLGMQSIFNDIGKDEVIEIDFDGIDVLTPSWADEFFTPLEESFNNRIKYLNTDNSSVERTLITLEKAKKAQGQENKKLA